MNFLRCLVFLYFTSVLAFAQSSQHNNPSTQPKTIVQNLYREVIARHPIGIPGDADMKIFAPYLSKALLHNINLALACSADEARQHPDPNLKPEIAWLESGLFSGENEQASPRTFHIESTQPETEGSFRVYVKLTWGSASKPWIWRVAAIVIRENGHFVVDDVLYLKDENRDVDSRLSEDLTIGCADGRWVGRGIGNGQTTTPKVLQKPRYTIAVATAEDNLKLGTPLRVEISLVNTSDREITIGQDLSRKGEYFYQVYLTDAQGNSASKSDYHRMRRGEPTKKPMVDFQDPISVVLKPGDSLHDYVLLGELFDLHQAGKYIFHVERIDSYSKATVKSDTLTLTISE